jgi:hypothetical protein
MCARAPEFTSGTATTGLTVSAVSASFASCEEGIVAVQLPSEPRPVVTGEVVWAPSVANTDTPVASGCATPETVTGPSVTLPGALVTAFLAQGATSLHPEIGPIIAFAPGGWTDTLIGLEPPPAEPAWVTVTVSPGCRSGVRACASAPFCQQSPAGFSAVGVVVLTENGPEFAMPENRPMTTGPPVMASGRMASIVVWPNEGRFVASTASPLTATVGELARAVPDTVAEAMSATAAGVIRRPIDPRRGARGGGTRGD